MKNEDFEIRFPEFKESLPQSRPLSMDEYFRFVQMFHKDLLNQKAYKYWKEKRTVDVRFKLS